MKKIAIVALLSAFVATPALAADNTGKFYIAGDLGSASFTNANFFINGAPNVFPNPGVVRVAGGYHFSPQLALEVGYSIFGDSVLTTPGGSFTLAARSFQVAAVGSLPLSPQFDLTGKLGLSNNSYTLSAAGNAFLIGPTSSSQSDLLLGIGAQFHVNRQVSVRAQYESFGKFDNYAQPLSASAISLGVAYNF